MAQDKYNGMTEEEFYAKNPGAFRKGQSGNPLGRPKKARNRINVKEKMEELGCDPFEVLAHVAMNNKTKLGVDEDISVMQRTKAAVELASYMAPKLKSVEIKEDGEKVTEHKTVVILPSNGREMPSMITQDDKGVPFEIDINDTNAQVIEVEEPEENWGGQSEDR